MHSYPIYTYKATCKDADGGGDGNDKNQSLAETLTLYQALG